MLTYASSIMQLINKRYWTRMFLSRNLPWCPFYIDPSSSLKLTSYNHDSSFQPKMEVNSFKDILDVIFSNQYPSRVSSCIPLERLDVFRCSVPYLVWCRWLGAFFFFQIFPWFLLKMSNFHESDTIPRGQYSTLTFLLNLGTRFL